VVSSGTSANSNLNYVLHIEGVNGTSGDLNFSAVVNNTPTEADIAPGPGCTAAAGAPLANCDGNFFVGGTDPALGDVMGSLSSTSTLGLTNNPCSNQVFPGFTFLNATVDIDDTIDPVPQASTNVGSGTTMDNMWSDNGSSTTGPGADAPWNAAWPGMDAGESANGLPAQVDEYPSYLNILFDPDFPATPGTNAVQPLARYAGAVNVVGSSVTLNLVLFAPNALSDAFPAPHPFHDLAGLGYTSIAVLNNPAAAAAVSSITDFCGPLDTTTIVNGISKVNNCSGVTTPPCNNQSGISNPASGADSEIRYTNPSVAGTYLYTSFQQSLRDADDDGKENSLDACPVTLDSYNPRVAAGPSSGGRGDSTLDGDDDGIPTACDTNGNGAADSDTDAWLNTGDNCPQAANGTPQLPDEQTDSEISLAYGTTAPRGGPRGDSIGDACDTDDTLSNGTFYTTLTVDAQCIGGTDVDSDGWCATNTANTNLNDPLDSGAGAASRIPEDYDAFFPLGIAHAGSGLNPPMEGATGSGIQARQPAQVCHDGIDNDGDTLVDLADFETSAVPAASTCRPRNVTASVAFPTCPVGGCEADLDGDGFSNEAEILIGTDPLGRCELGSVPGTSTDWPLDLDSGAGPPNSLDRIALGDLTAFLAPIRYLDKSPPNALYNTRYDLIPGPSVATSPWVQLDDLTSLIAGTTATPPMTSGVKAFNGGPCTAHPTYGD
jgi:hypothetical protein